MATELDILKELQSVFNRRFMDKCRELLPPGETLTFSIPNFSTISMNELAREHQEFGIIYPKDTNVEIPVGINSDAIIRETYSIITVIMNNKNIVTQLSIMRSAMIVLLLKERWDFLHHCNRKIDAVRPVYFGIDDKDSDRYLLSGVELGITRGI